MSVNYIEYDQLSGKIYTCGYLSENLFPPPSQFGGTIIAVDDPVNILDTIYDETTKTFRKVEQSNKPDLLTLKVVVIQDLSRTDYTQAIDAPEHIDAFLIEEWKQYRSSLRTAYNLETVDAIIAALPTSDPKGLDFYKQFR
jgi:hypothetical protein